MARIKFGALIRDFRQQRGWTQADLARELGYESPQFISLLERDQSKVPTRVLGQLIVLLGIPENQIVDVILNDFQSTLRSELNEGKTAAQNRRRE